MADMTEQRKPRVPLVPSPKSFEQFPRVPEEQTLPDYLQRERDLQRANGGHAGAPMPVLTPLPKTAKAVADVMSQIGTIAKGGRNEFHGYSYARMEDLLHTLTPLMGKHGIMVTQNLIKYSMVETRVVGEYEFVTYVENEVSPPVRQVGMCQGRDRKGNIDDKALNKCHTAARKYFLMGLFQVPAGDFDDSDAEPAPAPVASAPVPRPTPTEPNHPYRLGRIGAGVNDWTAAFIGKINAAKSQVEVAAWENRNDLALQGISDKYSDLYERIRAAIERKLEQLTPPAGLEMPSPRGDPTAAINWVAQQLAEFKSHEAAIVFWNKYVAPRETEFSPIDFDVLLAEWRRTDARLSPPPDDEEEPDPATGEYR